MSDRRAFVGSLAAAGFAALHGRAGAQSSARVRRVGLPTLGGSDAPLPPIGPLRDRLRELGFEDGRSLALVQTHADGRIDRLDEAAAGVVRRQVEVIVAPTNPVIAAARRATSTVPIVMVAAVDPVGHGFVASLARPLGNVTGLCLDVSAEWLGKYLELLREMKPGLQRVGVIRQPQSGWSYAEFEKAAHRLSLALEPVDVATLGDFEQAFETLARKRVEALALFGGTLVYMARQRIAELALEHRLPAIHAFREYAQAGLMMTYGPELPQLFRRAADYVAQILRGARPADLPVEQPSEFELVINTKTVRALGLTIPQSIRARAPAMIE